LLAAVFAAGLAACALFVRSWPVGKLVAPTVVCAVLALFFVVTQPARARGLAHSTVAFRESVLLTRPSLDPWSEENRRIITVGITNPAFVYDANLFHARSLQDLLLLCAQADASGRPLWLNLGHLWILRERQPSTQQAIDEPALFTDHQLLRGEYPHCDRMVCRYVPGGMAAVDLAEFLSPEDIAYIKANAGVSPEKYFAK